MQAELPHLSTHAVHLIAENSHHLIQSDAPWLVVASVREVVEASRRHRPLDADELTALAHAEGKSSLAGATLSGTMCGRATLRASPDDLREIFELDEAPVLPARYNIAPTQPIGVVRRPHHLELLRWGLPSPKGRGPGINVRVETVARAPDYRESFRQRRCLVVVDGFYEWQPVPGKKAKQPFFVRREDGKPFALAGIWSHSVTTDGEVLDACGIITGPSTGVVAPLHDRMPLMVPKPSFGLWLSTELRSQEALALMDREGQGLVSYPVGTWVNVAANDDPRCIEPVETKVTDKGA